MGYVGVVPAGTIYINICLRSLFKSKLSKVNRLDSNDILLHRALTDAEFEFFDTIYVKIGYDKGYIHYWSKKGSI